MSFNILINPELFREAANDFVSNGGVYTKAPEGSGEFRDYWEMQEQRCQLGYSAGGMWIPGRYYFYLNFTPISRVSEETFRAVMHEKRDRRGKLSKMDLSKVMSFPSFLELDYEWWNLKHIAWFGGSFQTSNQKVVSPGQKHVGCIKTRGAGFSYKEAADGVYNYTFIPGSKNYYFASAEDYLIKDGILTKVQPMLDFINDNCPYWKQNRQVRRNMMHQRASFLDNQGMERGTFSEIIGQVVDNPNKTRGKRGRKLTFEESGSFKQLKQALAIALGSIRDGSIYVGQATVFGTGGEEGPSIEGLEDIISQPDIYDMLEFVNAWGNDGTLSKVGYFVPFHFADLVYIQPNGRIDSEASKAHWAKHLAKLEQAKDFREADRYRAEYPETINDALKRISGNPFDIAEIDKQIRLLETDQSLTGMLRYGRMIRVGSKAVFGVLPKAEARPVEEYPHGHLKSEQLRGCVTIATQPYKLPNGNVPEGMYTVVLDGYAIEQAEDETSLFVATVVKNFNPHDQIDVDLPQAWYEGRPRDMTESYEQTLGLALMYNADIQGEIGGGGQAFVNYARAKGFGHMLKTEPESVTNKEGKRSGVFMAMPTERKRLGLTYFIDWHRRGRAIDENGEIISTVSRIMWLGLLREMRMFNSKRNADRISAMIVYRLEAAAHSEEALSEVAVQSDDDYWSRAIYHGDSDDSTIISPY